MGFALPRLSTSSVILSEVEGSPRSDAPSFSSLLNCMRAALTRRVGMRRPFGKAQGRLSPGGEAGYSASLRMTKKKRKSIASPFENTQGRLRSFDSSSFRSG